MAVEGEAHTVVRELPAPAFERSPVDSSCTATQQNFRFWEIGPEDDTLPTAELVAFGQGAARPVYYAVFGSPLGFSGRWVDAQAISCFPTETIRGRRCLPRAITLPVESSWADPECTQELIYNPEDATHAVRFDGGMVGSVHPLSPYRSEDVFVRMAGVCTLLPDSATLMSHVGASVDLVGLPELIERLAGS